VFHLRAIQVVHELAEGNIFVIGAELPVKKELKTRVELVQ
jgi:hypothetical protein